MDHGQESTGSPPTSLPSQGPGRRGSPPRFVSWPSWSSRRPSDRAFRSASRSASPHIHARGVVISVRRSPAPSRCSSWRAERGTSLGSRSARAPRAERTCLVVTQSSHIARAHVSTQVRTSLLLLRRWVAALPGRRSHTGSGTRHPRCARGGCARALRGAARSTSLGVRHQGGSGTKPSNCVPSSQLHTTTTRHHPAAPSRAARRGVSGATPRATSARRAPSPTRGGRTAGGQYCSVSVAQLCLMVNARRCVVPNGIPPVADADNESAAPDG